MVLSDHLGLGGVHPLARVGGSPRAGEAKGGGFGRRDTPEGSSAPEVIQGGSEVLLVPGGLEAQEVEPAEGPHQIRRLGKTGQDIGARKGGVEKETRPALEAQGPEFAAHQHEVVVVNPDEVVLLHGAGHNPGEPAVHPAVVLPVLRAGFAPVRESVEQGPEGPVGEPVVEAIHLFRAHVHRWSS